MERFYFTYGTSDSMPFHGGWSIVDAPDRTSAIALFRALHPDSTLGLLNCSSIYTEDDFVKTSMFYNGNFGYYCQEYINVEVFRG